MIIDTLKKRYYLRNATASLLLAIFFIASTLPVAGHAGSIDHKVSKDESGIWNPKVYRGLMGVLSIADLGGGFRVSAWQNSMADNGLANRGGRLIYRDEVRVHAGAAK